MLCLKTKKNWKHNNGEEKIIPEAEKRKKNYA